MNKTAMEKLTEIADTLPEIKFDPLWANGTGYLDHAVTGMHAPLIEVGEMKRATDELGRIIVLIGTDFGNVAVFQRFPTGDYGVVVQNTPSGLTNLLGINGALSSNDIELLIGNGCGFSNIGKRLQSMNRVVQY